MTAEITIAVAACLVGVLYLLYKHIYGLKRTALKNGQFITRVPGLPIVGVALQLSPQTFISFFEDCMKKYGPIFDVYVGQRRMIMIGDAAMAKELLMNRPKYFRRLKAFNYAAAAGHLETSSFFAHGNAWSVARKFTAPSFNKQNVESHANDIWQIAKKWTRDLQSHTSAIDFQHETLSFTLKVITKAGFGIDDTEKDSYFNSSQFMKDVTTFFAFTVQTLIFPLPMSLFSYFPSFAQHETQAREGDARLTQACMEVIAERRKELYEENHVETRSVLDTLLRKEEGLVFSDKEVLSNVKAFYLAGSETTSISIAWSIYLLIQHPQVLQRVRAESDAFYHKVQSKNGLIEVDDLTTLLPFTEAVFKETIRLFGPASLMGHSLEDDQPSFTFANGLTVTKDDDIVAYFDGVSRNESYFNDPWAFDPDRWLDSKTKTQCEAHFLSFGYGPRVCPGQRLAMLEGILAIAALSHELDFALGCEAKDIHRILQFTSVPDKMPIVFSPRHRE